MTAPPAPLSSNQRAFFGLLQKRHGQVLTTDEILSATGWKPGTWQDYLAKGFYDPYLSRREDGAFTIRCGPDVTEWAFARQATQSRTVRSDGSPLKEPLAHALTHKARANMVLALELYNRPSLTNRLDAFSMLFCTAWEQLLKAEIVEKNGEDAIFTSMMKGSRRESLSLQACIEKLFETSDPVRKNLVAIADLRHQATHLLMPEVQAVASQMFQAGVLNFSKRFVVLVGDTFLPSIASGLLALVHEPSPIDAVNLKKLYGTVTASDIAGLIKDIEERIVTENDVRFAVTVNYHLVLTKKDGVGDISLVAGPGAGMTGVVIEKPVDATARYPHLTQEAANAVATRTGKKFSRDDLFAVIEKEGWKKANNEFHFFQTKPDTHKYSDAAIDRVCVLLGQPGYLDGARRWRQDGIRKKRDKQKRLGGS